MTDERWPALPLAEWEKTYATLHMWSQIVGKIRLALTPLVNHWWNVPFYVTPRGLTTSTIHYGDRGFQMDFDFLDHQLVISCDSGPSARIALVPCTVSDFYRKVMAALHELGIDVKIWPVPVEVEHPVPFLEDTVNRSYDPEYSHRLWRILFETDRVFTEFRSRFTGKCSPVHFFWGSFDLAVTRFSGRQAPEREGADPITREAYSHEVISHGFWPGRRPSGATELRPQDRTAISAPAFYAYVSPEPAGFREARIAPPAFYSDELKEWILLYDDMRKAPSPEQALLAFMQSTYETGAELAGWNRRELERMVSRR